MTQKGDLYAELFSALPGVIMMYCMLSQLNILCNNLIKPYFTKMTTNPLFTIHMIRATISRVLQRIGFDQSGVIHTSKRSVLMWSKNIVFNFTAVRYSLHKCSETIL